MSKYTTEVRYICEVAAGLDESVGYSKINEVIEAAAPKVFDFNFPIWDENYRLPLEIKILKHFYTREICEETVGLWKLRLEDRLNLIMPYYNQLYKTTTIEFNPLYDVDYGVTNLRNAENTRNRIDQTDEKVNKTNTGTVSDQGGETANLGERGNTTTTGRDTSRYSDTPQGEINDLYENKYLTNANIDERGEVVSVDKNNTNTTSRNNTSTRNLQDSENRGRSGIENETIKNTDQFVEMVKGARGGMSFSKKIMEYRDTLLNIDRMILDDLNVLFFGLWR